MSGDIVSGSLGSALAYDVSFAAGKLTVSLTDASLGLASSVSVDEKLVLNALLKLIPPGGTAAEIAGFIVNIVESASGV